MSKIIWIVVPLALVGFYFLAKESKPEVVKDPVVEVTELVKEETPEVVKEASINFIPTNPIQGELVLLVVDNLSGTTTLKNVTFNGQTWGTFDFKNKPSALLALDLRMTTGTYPVVVTFSDGTTLNKNLVVGKRAVVEAPLGIPESLGGNTTSSEQTLLSTLVQEGAIINAIKTSPTKLWNGSFRYPLDGQITITDVYGYSRVTGASSLAHKGTDFRAKVGTSVYAMNSGKVAFKSYLRNYGNIVALDHGLGLLTIYMHLSEVLVNERESLQKGALIARSGDTGYVLGPHLHLTVRVNNVSIDPMKFIGLLGE